MTCKRALPLPAAIVAVLFWALAFPGGISAAGAAEIAPEGGGGTMGLYILVGLLGLVAGGGFAVYRRRKTGTGPQQEEPEETPPVDGPSEKEPEDLAARD